MYQQATGGTGSSLEINKNTGEIIQYYNMKDHLLTEMGDNSKKENDISKQKALTQAVKYIKEWIPSDLHNYAMPIEEPYVDEKSGSYSLVFPRIVNGIVVKGDQINVGIAADGSINSININYQDIENWPSSEEAISEKEAKRL